MKTKERVKLVTILVTHRCNLRCSYCYVRDFEGGSMSLKRGKAVIQDAFSRDAEDFDRLEIAFLGGEPFCESDMIIALSEWIWGREWPKPYILTASSNGTLLTFRLRDWLWRNRNRFLVSLSYDGSSESQDRNRCGSSKDIDLLFFRRCYPSMTLKMTISEADVEGLSDAIIAMKEQGFLVNDTFATGMMPWSGDSLKTLEKELHRLCLYELAHPGTHPSDLLNINLIPVLLPPDPDCFRCGAGRSRVTYDCDGRMYACHLLSPLTLSGETDPSADSPAAGRRGEHCCVCVLDAICPCCPGASFLHSGSLWKREPWICEVFHRQVYYACVFQMRRLLHEEKTEENQLRFAAIRKIMSEKATDFFTYYGWGQT